MALAITIISAESCANGASREQWPCFQQRAPCTSCSSSPCSSSSSPLGCQLKVHGWSIKNSRSGIKNGEILREKKNPSLVAGQFQNIWVVFSRSSVFTMEKLETILYHTNLGPKRKCNCSEAWDRIRLTPLSSKLHPGLSHHYLGLLESRQGLAPGLSTASSHVLLP